MDTTCVSAAERIPPETTAWNRLVEARWPAGVLCPRCRGREPAFRAKRLEWRCRSCRYDFTVTTGTAMHRSKVNAAKWVNAAWLSDLRPAMLARELDVSAPAARRMADALEMTGLPPGEGRLKALMNQPSDRSEALRRRLPATFDTNANPIDGLSRGQRTVLGILRGRIRGTTLSQVAAESRLSEDHARRCLNALAERGFARREKASLPWGYGSRKVVLWSLNLSEDCVSALAYLLPPTPTPQDNTCADRVPPELWSLFWNGASAKDLRLPDDAFFVATTLLDGPDPVARSWALRCLPIDALRRCRDMRGCNTGEIATRIDKAIARRADG